MTITQISAAKVAGGWHKQFVHQSIALSCEMRFAVFLPPQVEEGKTVPALYWLSGLTCTDENFMQKAGAFKKAAELGIAIIAADTSPRGHDVADDPEYDLGKGAGFYLNATEQPWAAHYHMYDYIVFELPALVEANFAVSDKRAISGHSMGGHGALTIGLKNQNIYCSISAFSPICNPMEVPWGQKAFNAYLGANKAHWASYDACQIISCADELLPILIDQGDSDPFLAKQLKPENLQAAVPNNLAHKMALRMHAGYDHSYYFISSFIDEHLAFHAKYLF